MSEQTLNAGSLGSTDGLGHDDHLIRQYQTTLNSLKTDAERYRFALVECAEAFEAIAAGGGVDADAYARSIRAELVMPNAELSR